MHLHSWPRRPIGLFPPAAAFFWLSLSRSRAAEKDRLRVDDYQIDADPQPHAHKLTAQAKVKITALEDLNVATFDLHNDLAEQSDRCRRQDLTAERVPQDSTVRVSLAKAVAKGDSTTLPSNTKACSIRRTIQPVSGMKLPPLATIPVICSMPGDWFPVNAYGIDRFSYYQRDRARAHGGDRQRQVSTASGTPALKKRSRRHAAETRPTC